MDDARVTRVGFGAVLAVAEFRAMWAAELLSVCGDQLARVALAVLVYQRTSSAADVLSPAHTIAAAGAAGAAVAVPIARAWRRVGLEGP
jgi:hypothetical protein